MMRRLRAWALRLTGPFRAGRLERELADEIESHLHFHIEDNIRRGMTPAEARRHALVKLGGVEQIKEAYRERWGTAALQALLRDLRYSLRMLRKHPGFAAVTILTLAFGIGANSLIFSAIQGMLIRPLPFRDGDRMVWIYTQDHAAGLSRQKVSGSEIERLATQTTAFETFAGFGDRGFTLTVNGRPAEWKGLRVTQNLFSFLGVIPVQGRPFAPEDVRPDNRLMVLGYERWQQDFGGDPAIIGSTLTNDKKSYTIIGVLPPGLEFPMGRSPQTGNGTGFRVGVQDFWVLGQESLDDYPGEIVLGRLSPGTTIEMARAGAETVARALATEFPQTKANRTFEIVTFRDQMLGLARPMLQLVQGFTALVLLIACGNLISLMLSRASAKEREFAVRAALGASPFALIRSFLTESLLLTASGGSLGLLLAWWGRDALRVWAAGRIPLIDRLELDGSVMLFTGLLCVVTMIVFAIAPAVMIAKTKAHHILQGGGHSHTSPPRLLRLRNGLVISQVAATLILLIGAALVFRSFSQLMSVDIGYEPERVIAADINLFGHPKYAEFYRQLNERLRGLPGVEAVGMIQSTPLTGKWKFREQLIVAGQSTDAAQNTPVPGSLIAFDYFKAMGIPVISGRPFTEQEFTSPDPPSVIINEALARRFFPGQNPLEKTLPMRGEPRAIVGVVKDTRDMRLDTPAEPQWYEPFYFASSQLIVRVSGKPSGFVESLRRELIASDPRLIVNRVEPLEEIIAASIIERRLAMQLMTILAGIALALGSIGLYGVLSFNIAQRQREFGVRIALGAQQRDVMRIVLRQGLGLTITGIGIGLLASIPLTKTLRSLLFEISPTDPFTLTATSLLLIAVAGIACCVPAWRAATADPLTVLRTE
jgi:predicted permease